MADICWRLQNWAGHPPSIIRHQNSPQKKRTNRFAFQLGVILYQPSNGKHENYGGRRQNDKKLRVPARKQELNIFNQSDYSLKLVIV